MENGFYKPCSFSSWSEDLFIFEEIWLNMQLNIEQADRFYIPLGFSKGNINPNFDYKRIMM
jgi:hypothetical protein